MTNKEVYDLDWAFRLLLTKTVALTGSREFMISRGPN